MSNRLIRERASAALDRIDDLRERIVDEACCEGITRDQAFALEEIAEKMAELLHEIQNRAEAA